MALINHAKREINAKIVYYGPGNSGKSTSVRYIYDRIKPSLRGELKQQAAGADALLFFDFSPFEQLMFGGYRIRLHIYTLPGQVGNPAAWKMTLKGADALVLVASADPGSLAASRESFAVLRDYLTLYGVGLHDIPALLQLTHCDGEMAVDAVAAADALDLRGVPVQTSVASRGEGVLEALSHVSREVMARISTDSSLHDDGPMVARQPEVSPLVEEAAMAGHEEEEVIAPPTAITLAEADGQGGQPSVRIAGTPMVSENGEVVIPLEVGGGEESRRIVLKLTVAAG